MIQFHPFRMVFWTTLITLTLIQLGVSQHYDILLNNPPSSALSYLQQNREIQDLLNNPVNYLKDHLLSHSPQYVDAKDDSAICEEKILSLMESIKTSKESLRCKIVAINLLTT